MTVDRFHELVGCFCYENSLDEPDGGNRILLVSYYYLCEKNLNLDYYLAY